MIAAAEIAGEKLVYTATRRSRDEYVSFALVWSIMCLGDNVLGEQTYSIMSYATVSSNITAKRKSSNASRHTGQTSGNWKTTDVASGIFQVSQQVNI